MENRIYFNDVQRRVQLIAARTSVIVAGRRTGKTDSIASPFSLRNMQRMPGSGGGIAYFQTRSDKHHPRNARRMGTVGIP